jgi:outer membrane immunogenic protein
MLVIEAETTSSHAQSANPTSLDQDHSWDGYYGGVVVGRSWQDNGIHDLDRYSNVPTIDDPGPDAKPTSFDSYTSFAGILGGFNKQYGEAVVGIEADLTHGDFESSTWAVDPRPIEDLGNDELASVNYDSYFTVRGRFGMTLNTMLFYGTLGLAVADVETRLDDHDPSPLAQPEIARFDPDDSFSKSETKFGYAIGAGVEMKLNHRWNGRVEALLVDFGKETYHTLTPQDSCDGVQDGHLGTCDYRIKNQTKMIRFALTYRFSD